MVVLTHYRKPGKAGPVGLNIGQENAQEFFPRGFDTIELELDHLRIACRLGPSFWDGQPVIHDFRLSSWLESKRSSGKLSNQPAPVALEPRGENAFRLTLIVRDNSEHADAQTAPVDQPKAPQIVSVVPAYNRRRFDAGHDPERRRVARLKADDRSSAAANH